MCQPIVLVMLISASQLFGIVNLRQTRRPIELLATRQEMLSAVVSEQIWRIDQSINEQSNPYLQLYLSNCKDTLINMWRGEALDQLTKQLDPDLRGRATTAEIDFDKPVLDSR